MKQIIRVIRVSDVLSSCISYAIMMQEELGVSAVTLLVFQSKAVTGSLAGNHSQAIAQLLTSTDSIQSFIQAKCLFRLRSSTSS